MLYFTTKVRDEGKYSSLKEMYKLVDHEVKSYISKYNLEEIFKEIEKYTDENIFISESKYTGSSYD